MIPLIINSKRLCEIFEPDTDFTGWSDDAIQQYCISAQMNPTAVYLTSETYSRDAERTADYELEELTIVNRKAKPEFEWRLIRAEYIQRLMNFLEYDYNFKNTQGIVEPREDTSITVKYLDFVGMRTITSYLGQTIEGVLVEYDGVQYWENFRLAFPEK